MDIEAEIKKLQEAFAEFQKLLPDLQKIIPVIEKIIPRVTALEEKPANKVSPAEVAAALEDHPVIADFRAFLAKWGNKSA